MSNTITVRLTPELAEWLANRAKRTGRARERVIREQLEKARASEQQRFLRLAGSVSGPRNLSARKGLSRT